MPRDWIDVTVPVRHGMIHWPGDPPVVVERVEDMAAGAPCNVSRLDLSAHTGTHQDAPLHYLRDGVPIDRVSVELTVGPARVIATGAATAIGPETLRPHRIRKGERILLKTANSRRDWPDGPFPEAYAALTPDGAEFLADRAVRCVGIDFLSIGGPGDDGVRAHRALLSAGVAVIEGLDLRRVRPGRYLLLCLPLRLAGGDGAPVRALLRASAATGAGRREGGRRGF